MDSRTFISLLSERTGRDAADIAALLKSVGEVIADKVKDGDAVVIPGFGSFESKMRSERVATHPSSGVRLLVPPKISLVFKPSTLLKQKLRDNGLED